MKKLLNSEMRRSLILNFLHFIRGKVESFIRTGLEKDGRGFRVEAASRIYYFKCH